MHSYIILFLFTHMCTILQACFPHMYTILHNLETNLFWLSCKQFLWILWHLKFTGCMCQHPYVIVWLNWNLKSFSQHHLQLINLKEKLKLDRAIKTINVWFMSFGQSIECRNWCWMSNICHCYLFWLQPSFKRDHF